MIPFDAVMSGNKRVIDIFSRFNVNTLEEQERIAIHGSDIRALIHA